MADARWKARERQAAQLFGARRNVLSGSSGRDDRDPSDSTHPRLFIETKKLAATAVRTLWAKTKALAGGKRTPVLVIYDKGKPGGLIVVHEDDFALVAADWLTAQDDDAVLRFEHAVAVLRANEKGAR